MQSPFPLWSVRLAPGDALVLCTDGVTEAFDAGGVPFGLEGLRRVVADTPADALYILPQRLVEALERFSVGGGPRDDLAVLAVQYRPPDVEVGGQGGEWWRISTSSDARRHGARATADRGHPASPRRAGLRRCTTARGRPQSVLANIAKHAGGGRRGGLTSHLEVRLLSEEIQIQFEDTGPGQANVLTMRRGRPADE